MKPSRWIPIALALVVALVVALVLLFGDKGEGPSDGTCTQDRDCASDQVCCKGTCTAQGDCAPETKAEKAPVKSVDRDRKDTEALLKGIGGKLPAAPRVRPPSALPKDTCKEHSDCATGLQTCDVATKRCEEPPICLRDQDCQGGKLCHYGECVESVEGCRFEDCMPSGYCNFKYQVCEKHVCNSDNDCAGPRRCSPHTKNCVECLEDTDCPGSDKCQPGLFCMGEGGCAGDGDCDEGLCDISKARCHTPKCQDDELEDNDKWSSAKPLEDGVYELKGCPGDNDWFKLELNEGEGFIAQLRFKPLAGMLEARLHDINGLEVRRAGNSKQTGDVAMVWPRVEKDGVYYLGIKHQFGIGVSYRMKLATWPEGFCQNDEYEPNDDSGVATALDPGTHWPMKMCVGDDDWVIQSLKKGQSMQLLVEVIEGDPPRVEVFRDDEEKPILVDDSRVGQKVLVYKSDRASDYYIRVSPLFRRAETLYHVKIDLKD